VKTPQEFRASLPRTPILEHVCQVHTIIGYLYRLGEGYDVNAVEIAEHSLREIAISGLSMMDPEESYIEQMRWQHGYYRTEPKPDMSAVVKRMQDSVREAFAGVAKMVEKMKAGQTPEQREAASIRKYKRAIEAEREKGQAYVKREGARVEKEIGL
jgi:hypothetical protein